MTIAWVVTASAIATSKISALNIMRESSKMMQSWADYLDNTELDSKVIPANFNRNAKPTLQRLG